MKNNEVPLLVTKLPEPCDQKIIRIYIHISNSDTKSLYIYTKKMGIHEINTIIVDRNFIQDIQI